MRGLKMVVIATSLAATLAGGARAQDVPELVIAKDLLLPCQEADNDPRDGYLSQLECIGFVRGFIAGLDEAAGGPALCLPDANRDDALRRAFVSWVHASYSKRSKLPVGEALHAALQASFTCD